MTNEKPGSLDAKKRGILILDIGNPSKGLKDLPAAPPAKAASGRP